MQPLPLNLGQLVADATTDFLKVHKFKVEDKAQRALLEIGKKKELEIQQQVADGKVKADDMKAGLIKFLEFAMEVAQKAKSQSVGDETVYRALRDNCPVVPWC
ncbi:MAG: hypothetical protein HY671_03030 [Chloroflexi bacterium]|nr:hypothetical protein [Chloroflexota bacterium]